ncbi:MAG: succinylglutamate desuccinylase/aspartoacylase family protein [Saprospiraceae bacterium]|nr:succinylglutamate desuccinylase/aspartoacylase family protein [Saprospiraceae bacterium]
MLVNRVIGKYIGQEPGPLLICFGGIHGNEPSGVKALDLIFKMLEVEPITNPDFKFKGTVIGLAGNMKALKYGKRYIDRDLNRLWTREQRERVMSTPREEIEVSEEREMKEILEIIKKEVDEIDPPEIFFLDLHSTTATGGIFTLVGDNPRARHIGKELHAPVVLGLDKGLIGTTQYFFEDPGWPIPTMGIIFESGQHRDPLSTNRAIAAVTNCMRIIGCVDAEAVENRHDELLTTFSRNLPKVTKLAYCHRITEEDDFHMLPGFRNFQKIKKGQLLAHDINGPIYAPKSGYMLMPLYQSQGEDGFFIIKGTREIL